MPKTTTAKGSRASKAPKTPREPNPQRLYRSLFDQLEAGFSANALKTVDKLLRLNPADALAAQTKIQLLIALDRYPEALALLGEGADGLTRAYCLYKTGREVEARQVLAEMDEDESEERGVKQLEAQVNYRLEDYELARDGFDELSATADLDSPELADLQTNLAACNAHIDFLSSVPSHLASTSAPPIESLESAPVGPLIHSNPLFKVSTAAIASTSKAASKAPVQTKAPRHRRPKNKKEGEVPAEDRWIPKRERPGMAEEIVRKREKARGKNKEKLMTQGSAEPVPVKAVAGGAAAKKKKGKK